MQLQDIATQYEDVLSGGEQHDKIAMQVLVILESKNSYVPVAKIIEQVKSTNEGFIRSCLKLLAKNGFLQEKGQHLRQLYKLISDPKKVVRFINDTYGSNETLGEVNAHFEQYGFNELVASVAKQINHDNVVVKEYNEDRLWLGRYIDFLEKAKEYTSFRKADNQIARKKAKDIKKQFK